MKNEPYILLVDDEEDMRTGLTRVLNRKMPKVNVIACSNGLEALSQLQDTSFSLALLDIKMEGMDGLELLSELKMCDPWITVIMMTGFGTIEMAVEAIRKGAYDFIPKPFDNKTFLRTIQKGLERNQLLRENLYLREKIQDMDENIGLIGSSEKMRRFLSDIKTVAKSSYTTLVRGESGTGKELTARAIHQFSNRRDKPLIMVNCPAIPENLIESELFGHTKGAFTDATTSKKGLFTEAEGGTICLDEVGDLPLGTQAKLLRVLQEKEIRPLGSSRNLKVDVRIIALTNLNLEEMIRQKLFREDLYYRLNVVTLITPPLREIKEDIPELIHHFILKVCEELSIPPKTFCQKALSHLTCQNWPGNVRELQNFVRRAVMFTQGQVIRLEDLHMLDEQKQARTSNKISSYLANSNLTYKEAKQQLVDTFTTQYISSLMTKNEGNVTRSAEISGLSRAALQKIMRRLNIHAADFRYTTKEK